MALWLPDDRLIVTAAPGTASTSLLEALSTEPGATVVPARDVIVDGVTVVDQKHATVNALTNAGLFELGPGVRIVTTVRNPFDFWPSEWERTRHRWVGELRNPESWVYQQAGMVDRIVDAVELPFETWVVRALAEDLAQGAVRHLNAGHVAEADVVLRLEHLAGDVTALLGRPLAIPHRNRTVARRPYWQYYDAAARRAVATVFAPTLDRFDYRF
ncbi:MAG: hypothetical protein ACR2MB_08950 [Acidimicrobiales bacterium]